MERERPPGRCLVRQQRLRVVTPLSAEVRTMGKSAPSCESLLHVVGSFLLRVSGARPPRSRPRVFSPYPTC